MHHIIVQLEHVLNDIVPFAIIILELIAAAIIIWGSIKALFIFIKDKIKLDDRNTKIALVDSIAMAIEFMLAAEILSTLIIKDNKSLIILVAVCGLRIIVGLVLHWEKKHELCEQHTQK